MQYKYKRYGKGGQARTKEEAHKQRREVKKRREENRADTQIRDADSGQGPGPGQLCSAVLPLTASLTVHICLRSSSAPGQ